MRELRHVIQTVAIGVAAALGLVCMFWLLYTYPMFVLLAVPIALWGLAKLDTSEARG